MRGDCFLRLTQFVWLLNVESVKDASEAWADGCIAGGSWQLTSDEVKKTLALRDDFTRTDIDGLRLA